MSKKKKVVFIALLLVGALVLVSLFFPAIKLWTIETRAHMGDTRARFDLGNLYYKGDIGQDKDFDKALYWFRKAADQKDVDALYTLGEIFEEGIVVVKDDAKALAYFLQAANGGHSEAQLRVGQYNLRKIDGLKQSFNHLTFHEKSRPLSKEENKSLDKAILWFKKAAAQGEAQAQFWLAAIYLQGYGGEHDSKQAIDLLIESADKGFSEAQALAGNFLIRGDRIEKNVEKGVSLLEEASLKGNIDALFSLGIAFKEGIGVTPDKKRAAHYFELAAEKEHAISQSILAGMYEKGVGVERNLNLAFKWYQHASEQGVVSAMSSLGELYSHGIGTMPKDPVQALYWTRKAAKAGDARALRNLGLFFQNGFGVFQNNTKAFKMYHTAALRKDREAQFLLGQCFENGTGCFRNNSKAIFWYQKASDLDNEKAMLRLSEIYYKSNQYDKAVKILEKLVGMNNAKSHYYLATMYLDGLGLEKNRDLAIDLLNKSRSLGYSEAQNLLLRLEQESQQ